MQRLPLKAHFMFINRTKLVVLPLSALVWFAAENANATVDFTGGQIVAQATDGSYSVKEDYGSVWSGVGREQVTASQVKSFGMIQAKTAAELEAAQRARTETQTNALAQAKELTAHNKRFDAANTINVNVSSLKPDTLVNTPAGRVKASTLKPGTQVQVAFNSAFHPSVKGGHDGATNGGSRGDHGTGTGGDNAHDHAFGGHTGAGHGFHM